MKASRNAFTLIELLVVVGIIGILATALIGPIQSMLLRSKQTKCASNLRQLYIATVLYTGDQNGALPITGSGQYNNPPWYNPLTPYLDIVMKNGSTIGVDTSKQGSQLLRCPGYSGPPREVTYAPCITWANKNIRAIPATSRKIWLTTSTDSYSVNNGGLQRFNFPYAKNSAQVVFFDGHVEPITRSELQARGSFPFNLSPE